MNSLKHCNPKGSKGFTLTEIMMGVLVFSILLALVTALQTGGSKAVTRIAWHGQMNQQGNYLEKFIPRAIEKSSVPSFISTTDTGFSTNAQHSIQAPTGRSILTSAYTSAKVLLSIPESTPVTPSNATGRVKWIELVLVPEPTGTIYAGLGKLYSREISTTYASTTYQTVVKPAVTTQGLSLMMEDVASVTISLPTANSICIQITAIYPRDRKLTQNFTIMAVSQGKAPFNIP